MNINALSGKNNVSDRNNLSEVSNKNPYDELLKELSPAPRRYIQSDVAKVSNCAATGYLGEVLEPLILERLPDPESLPGRAINYLTNVYGLFDSINEDLCQHGRLGQNAAMAAGEFVARGAASVTAVAVGTGLTLLGSVLGPAGAAGGIATGAFLLAVAPEAAAKINNYAFDLFGALMTRTKEALKKRRRS